MRIVKGLCFTALVLASSLVAKDGIKAPHFDNWVENTSESLVNDIRKEIVPTSLGAVQVYRKGHENPYLLILHGGFGGWDQAQTIGSGYYHEGFSLIAPSRIGYLGTPIPPKTYVDASAQADLMKELLDKLNVEKTAVLGFGAGAPVAFELAKKYPERVTRLVLESLGNSPGEDVFFFNLLEPVLEDANKADYVTYLTYLGDRFDAYSVYVEALELDTLLTGDDLDARIKAVTKSEKSRVLLHDYILSSIPISPRLDGFLNDLQGSDYWNTAFSVPINYSVPTIIVQAKDDANNYCTTVQAVKAAITGSKLILVKESGHMVWLGPNTKEWKKEVANFLKSK